MPCRDRHSKIGNPDTPGIGPAHFHPSHSPGVRLLSGVLAALLFFSGSPGLFAMTAYQAFGGVAGGGGKGSASNLQNAGAASAALTAEHAKSALNQTESTVAALQALQAAARAALANPKGLKNGLSAGWLDPYNPSGAVNSKAVPSTWSGITALQQSGNTVEITQGSQNAYLYWNDFNVGPATTVDFNQGAGGKNVGTWIAFNKVMGDLNPSQIFGSITAQGQVYILNQNGILFHDGSQVNTHALVASTLPINENLAGDALDGVSASGIANYPHSVPQFLFTALDKKDYDPNGNGNFGVSGPIGDVVVEQGASIVSPANAEHTGGLVALVGPNVMNQGTIETPNGQTILAAGLQVGLSPHSSADPSLRGLDVSIGAVADPSISTRSVLTGASTTGQTGIAENDGYLGIMEGDATIAGAKVVQNGVIDSSTSVSLNGRIDLMADYGAFVNPNYINPNGANGQAFLDKTTGEVVIGAGSVMRILPEWSSTTTVTGSALALDSVVSIVGSDVEMGKDAVIEAPGAVATAGALSETGASLGQGVTIQAGNWFLNGGIAQFVETGGGISLAQGALIDVSGSTDVQVNSSQDFVTLQLRGAELANSPLQQGNQNVRGQSLTLDERLSGTSTYDGTSYYWIGTPLGDATGYAALIERTVSQLTEAGGSVTLEAGGSITMQAGSSINVSGGWTQYSGGKFSTSYLITAGHLISVDKATPNLNYSGVYSGGATVEDFTKWGMIKQFDSPFDPTRPREQAPYISGAAGGSITIQAPSMLLDGTLSGNTVTGPRQLRETATLSTLPETSSLAIDLFGQALNLSQGIVQTVAPNAPSVTFATGSSSPSQMMLSPGLLSASGFGTLDLLDHDGSITVPEGVSLNAGAGGAVTLEAANLDIQGAITAPGGTISLTADLSPYGVINAVSLFDTLPQTTQPLTDVVTYSGPPTASLATGEAYAQYGKSTGGQVQLVDGQGAVVPVAGDQVAPLQAGKVTIGSGAVLSTAGLIVEDAPHSPVPLRPVAINGGRISVSGYRVDLERGGLLNVSAGELLPEGGAPVFGNAGTLAVTSGHDLDPGMVDLTGGSLRLGSTLEGYAGAGSLGSAGGTAGTLSLSANAIRIGGDALGGSVTELSPGFFDEGGFGTFNLTGIGLQVSGTSGEYVPGVAIAPGTAVDPQVTAEILVPSADGPAWSLFTPPGFLSFAPSLALKATGLSDNHLQQGYSLLARGDVVVGEGASVTLNPQVVPGTLGASAKTGSLSLSGQTVAVLGDLSVPGGSITISGGRTGSIVNDASPVSALVSVDIASSARISTAGEVLSTADPTRFRSAFGVVLSGGSITVSGNILAEAGSVLDASGASGLLDFLPSQLGQAVGSPGNPLMPSPLAYDWQSSGGTITLAGAEELYTDATLLARSGGATAPGGTLAVSSGRFYQASENAFSYDLNLAVGQGGSTIPAGFTASGVSAIGRAIPNAGGIAEGGGHLAAGSFAGGGFDSVKLGGNVLFEGPVSLSVPGSLTVANGGVLEADSAVQLSASYVGLGTPFASPLPLGSLNYPAPFDVFGNAIYLPALDFGTGRLTVTADQIDVGNIALEKIGIASLTARGGSIRGDGTLDMAGALSLDASQIYPASGTAFTLAVYNHDPATGAALSTGGVAGSITVDRNGSYALPLSAGGVLDLYASSISQNGVLLAPFGVINLGWSAGFGQPGDPLTGAGVAKAQNPLLGSPSPASSLTLGPASVTSVSAVDPSTGTALSIPYGTSSDGSSWIDPSGSDITTEGLAQKSVNLSASSLTTSKGSLLDLQGGGDLTALQWIDGNGGTLNLLGNSSGVWNPNLPYTAGQLVSYNGSLWEAKQSTLDGNTPAVMPQAVPTSGLLQNSDPTAPGYAEAGLFWTKITPSFALVPGHQQAYAPTGYSDGSLSLGASVRLGSSPGIAAGTYTLLPASYASQPGAYLITPTTSASPLTGSVTQPDGSVIVSGVAYGALDSAVTPSSLGSLFQLLSPQALASRVDFKLLDAGAFFSTVATSAKPASGGNLLLKASSSMALEGSVLGQGAGGADGASIDLSAPGQIEITPDGSGGVSGDVVLGASQLSSWSFGSLLIGGSRGAQASDGVTPVSVSATSIEIAGGAVLTGNDIILAANDGITLDAGSSVKASGDLSVPNRQLNVDGDGALIRVSVDSSAASTRSGSDASPVGGISIGPGVSLSGASITIDSSGKAVIDESATLAGKNLNLSAGTIAVDFGSATESGALNLGGKVLEGLSSAQSVNLSSYSSIEFFGSGVLGSASLASLGLHAAEILGDDGSSDTVQAERLGLDNAGGATVSGSSPSASGGELTLSGSVLTIGVGSVGISGFQNTSLSFSGGITGGGTGALSTEGNLLLSTPVLTGAGSSVTAITASGSIQATSSGSSLLTPGLGASLTISGSSLNVAVPIDLPSGKVSLEAIGSSAGNGNLTLSSVIDAGGVVRQLFNATEYTSGGSISLSSENGNLLLAGSSLNVAAQQGGASAGTLEFTAPNGAISSMPSSVKGTAPNGTSGSFTADLGSYNGGVLDPLESSLTAGGFTSSQTIRDRKDQNVSVTDVKAGAYSLSADVGSITVNGTIDASDVAGKDSLGNAIQTGGSIALYAGQSVVLSPTAILNASGANFDNSGKGGVIDLEAGNNPSTAVIAQNAPSSSYAQGVSVVDLQTGSTIDLAVAAKPRSIDTAGDSDQFGGTLLIRAPQTADATDVQVNPIGASISGASLVVVEGFHRQDAAATGTAAIDGYEQNALQNAALFMNNAGTVASRILPSGSPLGKLVQVAPGEEIDNSLGGLILNADWDLSTARFGADGAPGFLTLRANGNITLDASLSDGFASSAYTAKLLSQNTALPANFQSWSYQITAGADFGAADPDSVIAGSGAAVALGVPYVGTTGGGGQNVAPSPGPGALTADALAGYYQVVRTGTGNISIAASGDVQFWNQFASIYTAGVPVTDPTLGGTFDVPALGSSAFYKQNTDSGPGLLGAAQQSALYLPQFSYSGGSITVNAGGSITQLTHDLNGNTVADSDAELPVNWLYRRGALDNATGTFLQTSLPVNEVESTAWWVDFSNFFDDFGALGGGNILLRASGDISNINASIPTNFRMPARDKAGNLIPAGSSSGVELGGGDLTVQAGQNINAGVYYLESGNADLRAGGSILSNPTRDPNAPNLTLSPPPGADSPLTWLPTTFFLGKGSINVEASGDILMGPVANVFMTPQGVNNSYWYKTYFSTYAPSDSVDVQSLGGSITFREEAVTAVSSAIEPVLELWMNGFTDPSSSSQISYYQPWLRLAEPTLFSASSPLILSVEPPTLEAYALSGNITFQGNYTTMPAPNGNIALVAGKSVEGLTEAGVYLGTQVWTASQINLSDANPAAVNGVDDPLSMRSQTPASTSKTALAFALGGVTTDLTAIGQLFAETGSYFGANGSIQTKDALNDTTSLLHANDAQPLQIYAGTGDVSGLTLFSAKESEISAGGDITDIGLYIQNNRPGDVSLVSAGGNLVLYDPTSPLQILAQAAGSGGSYQSGDIQINGPGTLEVLAGGNLDLGNNPGSSDPTVSVGITSVGNSRNPALPFGSADVIAEAGIRLPTGLDSPGGLGLQGFVQNVLAGPQGATYLSELAATLTYSGDPLSGTVTAASFSPSSTQLSDEEKARLELQLFYIVLRDAGRNHNKAGSPGYGSYASGEQAIQEFFASQKASAGNILTWSQDIGTLNGGNIDIFAPGGSITLASTAQTGRNSSVAPGIITEGGGNVYIYTEQDVNIGIGRIFTLKGGDILMWSDKGNIAAGASAKTVASAPPTQVLIDPQSGDVETDLAGLATGGGIGVLATVAGIPPGNVDLIAPSGVIDAGDAGIRSSGNISLAATKVLNANNIASSGTTSGAPPAAPPPAAPNISGSTAASSTSAANNTAAQSAATNAESAALSEEPPSIINVEVLGYGGGDGPADETTTSSGTITTPQASL